MVVERSGSVIRNIGRVSATVGPILNAANCWFLARVASHEPGNEQGRVNDHNRVVYEYVELDLFADAGARLLKQRGRPFALFPFGAHSGSGCPCGVAKLVANA